MRPITATTKPVGNQERHTAYRDTARNMIRCGKCNGQVSVGGTVHVMTDLGVGFDKGKPAFHASYSKRVSGYSGFCLGCRRTGVFLLTAKATK